MEDKLNSNTENKMDLPNSPEASAYTIIDSPIEKEKVEKVEQTDKLDSVDVIQLEYLFEEMYDRKNFIDIISFLDKYGFRFIHAMPTWYKNKPCSNDLIFFRQNKVN